MDLFETMTGAKHRSWVHQRTLAILWNLMTIALLLLLGWVVVRVLGMADAPSMAHGWLAWPRHLLHHLSEGVGAVVFLAIGVVGATCLLALFFHVAVAWPEGHKRHVWRGAIVAMVLTLAISYVFSFYVRTLATYTLYYGSLATVAVLHVWLYLTSLAVLIGAEVNAQHEGLRRNEDTGTHDISSFLPRAP
jgi:membrane protein